MCTSTSSDISTTLIKSLNVPISPECSYPPRMFSSSWNIPKFPLSVRDSLLLQKTTNLISSTLYIYLMRNRKSLILLFTVVYCAI